jgi:acetyltransferase
MHTSATTMNQTLAPPPVERVEQWITPAGRSVIIRPIRPTDLALEREFISGLSDLTRYQRLLSARKLLPGELERFTYIDYAREMAVIAVIHDQGQQRQIGVARYVKEADDHSAEFAIVVADAWQRQGLGEQLLLSLARYARDANLGSLSGVTLSSNVAMRELARKLGMQIQRQSEDFTTVRLSMPLN